ncbi:MAG: substrate-binding domain-containing protein [Desulfobacterales bacterium]|uniref:Substrate-binding domain-containing protein n=1 Tax=Candidatus Desulfatibia vada TaxID=2841696 RepID=A0A8J6P1H5_9BACT|nr:substrate-binding domain-containing protein [Candidatus Desulfatibia vada]MBL6971292.1 substrate-binding domain-containing protein [Desulfobacterales bacterium]
MERKCKGLNKWISPAVLFCLVLLLFPFKAQGELKTIKMSTTTSTESSGLLNVLLPEFTKATGIRVKVFAKGTGAAIRDGIDGNVDVIFVHARAREEKFIRDGYGTKRYAVMHNDFVILGPSDDPAGIDGLKKSAAALKKIVAAKALFVSRGDDSGTHTKEQALWKATGLNLDTQESTIVKKGNKRTVGFVQPSGSKTWYLSIGQGMGKTITFADEKRAYTLADRGTYIKYKYGRDAGLDLEVLCESDPMLSNPYGVIPINPAKHPHVQHKLAEQFANWLVSAKGQSLILNYRLLGKQLFYPDAIK